MSCCSIARSSLPERCSSDEGEVWWAELAGLPSLDLASSDMLDLLRVFEEDDLSELFYRQSGEDWTYELK